MNNIEEYIHSGILELYVLGLTSAEETLQVNELLLRPEIQKEVTDICSTLKTLNASIAPNESIKPLIFAIIDYTERLQAGEQPEFPPELNSNSKVSDYDHWLSRKDMVSATTTENAFAKIIGFTPTGTTAIVWLVNYMPSEIHDSELERFLIVEGSCDINFNDTTYSLKAGDYLEIPLHVHHTIKVTSSIPCKLIQQRIAA